MGQYGIGWVEYMGDWVDVVVSKVGHVAVWIVVLGWRSCYAHCIDWCEWLVELC